MNSENPRYECLCVKCNKTFFAESKRALICLSCKAPDYIPGDLLTCSRFLRDDMALRDDLGNGRVLVSMSQELWNNWCAASHARN